MPDAALDLHAVEAAQRQADTRFDETLDPAVPVRRARTGHLLVQPRIDGEEAGWFILDTGAGGMVIDRAAADRVAMPVLEAVQVLGIGSAESARTRQGESFALGPVTISGLRYVELDLAHLSRMMGVDIAGIVGFDLLARAVVELDAGAPAVRLHDPDHYTLPDGRWQDLRFSNKHPVVAARFEGDRDGFFVLDTGSNDTVIFHAPAVQRYGLLEGRETAAWRGRGITGMVAHQRGRLDWFEFGGHRFERLRVSFHPEPDAAADQRVTGNIGMRLFSRFIVVFDYAHGRMAFVDKAASGDADRTP